MKTARNSSPFALWSVISVTRLCSPRIASWSEKSEISWRKLERFGSRSGGLVLLRDADELLEVLDPALGLDRALRLERVEVAAPLEHALDELGHRQLERAGHQRLDQRAEGLDGLERRRPDARLLGELESPPRARSRARRRSVWSRAIDVSPIPRRGLFAIRISETASYGLSITWRYAMTSLTSARS